MAENIDLAQIPNRLLREWLSQLKDNKNLLYSRRNKLREEIEQVENELSRGSDIVNTIERHLSGNVSQEITPYNPSDSWRAKCEFVAQRPEKYGIMKTTLNFVEAIYSHERDYATIEGKKKLYKSIAPTLSELVNKTGTIIKLVNDNALYAYTHKDLLNSDHTIKDKYAPFYEGYKYKENKKGAG